MQLVGMLDANLDAMRESSLPQTPVCSVGRQGGCLLRDLWMLGLHATRKVLVYSLGFRRLVRIALASAPTRRMETPSMLEEWLKKLESNQKVDPLTIYTFAVPMTSTSCDRPMIAEQGT